MVMLKEALEMKLKEYKDMEIMLSDPKVISDNKKYKEISKKYSEMGTIVQKTKEYFKILEQLKENTQLLKQEKDVEMKEMITQEIKEINDKIVKMEEELKILLLPKDPEDEKNIIFEIRAGTGGEESALFVADLFRMYKRYAESKGYLFEQIDFHPTELGGYKEIIFALKGKNAYGNFKFESGVHRVQRIPATESNGRIHTSAVTVAVLPEVEDVELEINEKDLRIDIFHSSGAGGQNVNKVATAVRITHLPTNTVVVCQDERSQYKNREKAMRILKARLYEKFIVEQQEKISKNRKNLVGTGDRSERIRTYNFPERRVTDHRINLTLYRLEEILDGNLDLIIQPLKDEDIRMKLLEFYEKG
ncbi:TPA: peptide chain release factor 1 [candidate division WOR-3 bacterium]|nr:peptide chain release factor 1 [candidate division WOR-3 bacterium]